MTQQVMFYSESEYDPLFQVEIEKYSEIKNHIVEFEKTSDDVVDYVTTVEEGEVVWHYVNEDLSIEVCEDEVQEALSEAYGDDISDLVSESGWFEELLVAECEQLEEQLKRRVSSSGKVSRVRSRQVRSRQAVRTTGMSKTALKRRARKAARTRRRDVGATRRAVKKRKKAMRRRRQLGVR